MAGRLLTTARELFHVTRELFQSLGYCRTHKVTCSFCMGAYYYITVEKTRKLMAKIIFSGYMTCNRGKETASQLSFTRSTCVERESKKGNEIGE